MKNQKQHFDQPTNEGRNYTNLKKKDVKVEKLLIVYFIAFYLEDSRGGLKFLPSDVL